MNNLGLRSCGLLLMLCLLGACANDALVGEQDGDSGVGEDDDGLPDGGDGDDDDENTPVDCPQLPPAEGAPCGQEGASCEYDDCIEPISKATCTGGRWLTEADGCPAPPEETCPDSPPAEGDPCTPYSVDLCTYDCASGLPADHGIEARCKNLGYFEDDVGVFELNDDQCQLCGGVENPAGCSEQNPCDAGFTCLPPAPPGGGGDVSCKSSGCSCDTSTNTWSCLPDCGGFHCVANDEVECAGTNNPEGCSDANPCAEGLSCMVPLEPVCLPSSCTCNAMGGWDCTEDCNGGECR
jgi:hypothetical protein